MSQPGVLGASWPPLDPDPQRFRQVLGHFATGVTVLTGVDDGEPVGFACQAFAALSLEPPLVLFCPAKTSATWPRLASSGRFTRSATTDREAPPEVLDSLLAWPRFADWM